MFEDIITPEMLKLGQTKAMLLAKWQLCTIISHSNGPLLHNFVSPCSGRDKTIPLLQHVWQKEGASLSYELCGLEGKLTWVPLEML